MLKLFARRAETRVPEKVDMRLGWTAVTMFSGSEKLRVYRYRLIDNCLLTSYRVKMTDYRKSIYNMFHNLYIYVE
ncbi:hypothetical protein PR118_001996 [Bacillus atrophaeus]|nr:hypothetical protein [Bacillus atrophaeus]